ncbi:MAG: radical SAM protein [candidate division KSB1 bacterium]|nr:radical SAM protein [candidate division KSB1 bacterium]
MSLSSFEIWEVFLEHGQDYGRRGVDTLYRLLVNNARLTWFDVDLTNICNLTCNHCFYHDNYSESSEPALSAEHLEEVIRQSLQAQIKILTFSGKEPTLSKHFRLAVQSARRAREEYAPAAKVGLITNGLTLPLNLPFLEKEPPDFIDISIDGWEFQNLIRSNTRDRVVANLQQAKQTLKSTRVGTSTVVRNDNWPDILTMIEHLAGLSNYFYFEPVVAAVDKNIDSLSEENLVAFVTNLRKLAQRFRQHDIRFSILLNGDQTLPLFYRGLLEPEDIEEDELNSLYIRQQFGKAQIDFILRIVPEYYWRAARLSYDGYWLGTCDLLQAPNYREVAAGNFVQTPDLQQLFKRALGRDSLFYQSLQEPFLYPCGHTPREQQYCLNCFSTRIVRMIHRRYGRHLTALQVAA